jgi:hypothetical protein
MRSPSAGLQTRLYGLDAAIELTYVRMSVEDWDMVEVTITDAFESWQQAARELLRRGMPPDEVRWVEAPAAKVLKSEHAASGSSSFVVPRRFVELAQAAAAHGSAERWATMYRVLWRLVHEDRGLLRVTDDPDVRALAALQPSEPATAGFELELSSPVARDATRKPSSPPPIIPAVTDLDALASSSGAGLRRHSSCWLANSLVIRKICKAHRSWVLPARC